MSRKKTTPARKARGGTLVGMFIGLVLGVCIAAGVVWYINRAHTPFIAPAKPTAPPATADKPGGAAQPLPLPGKPGDPVPEKRFQFYDILPGKADAVPDKADAKKDEAKKEDSKKDEAKKDDAKKPDPKKDELKQPIFFQAGSFTSPQDADNQKARLALMGLEANILQVMVQDKTFYRVQLGPFRTLDEANKARSELAKAGIDASPIKKEQ
jgi:cell division protein FtsN